MSTNQELVDETLKQLTAATDATIADLDELTNTSADTVKVPVEALMVVKMLLSAQSQTINGLNDYIKSVHELAQTITW